MFGFLGTLNTRKERLIVRALYILRAVVRSIVDTVETKGAIKWL